MFNAATSRASITEGPADPTIVVLLDTGFRATHEEFDFRSADSTEDQIVGWWNFADTEGSHPQPFHGEHWDRRHPIPFDDDGHGTATMSLAAGLNVADAASKYPSFAPGIQVAMGRVCRAGGPFGPTCGFGLEAALEWAVDTLHADVISISLGNATPWPGALESAARELRRAREAGALIVVSNGNGIRNSGLAPEPGWMKAFASSPHVLTVGAASLDKYTTSTDPEVTAPYAQVPVASSTCDSCYDAMTGTSFSAPIVAGMAAALIAGARAGGRETSPEYVERLIKFSARDTMAPPMFEGYGVVDEQTFKTALQHARSGTLPQRPNVDVNTAYDELLAQQARTVWAETLGPGAFLYLPVHIDPQNGPGVLAGTSPFGLFEGELYAINVSKGQRVEIDLHVVGGGEGRSSEVLVFDSNGPAFDRRRLVASTPHPAYAPTLSFTAHRDATLAVLVLSRPLINLFQSPSLRFTMISVADGRLTPIPFLEERHYATWTVNWYLERA